MISKKTMLPQHEKIPRRLRGIAQHPLLPEHNLWFFTAAIGNLGFVAAWFKKVRNSPLRFRVYLVREFFKRTWYFLKSCLNRYFFKRRFSGGEEGPKLPASPKRGIAYTTANTQERGDGARKTLLLLPSISRFRVSFCTEPKAFFEALGGSG